MRKGEAARTAQTVAFARAIETRQDARERVFEDPLAERFLGRDGRLMLALLGVPGGARAVMAVIDGVAPGQYAYAVGRTAYIDEVLTAALARGVPQVVILGAGYDARAFRIPGIERARVFEADHPDTQAVKRDFLADLLAREPERVTFAGVDFERQGLGERLEVSGFSFEEVSFFIWEGVTQYLQAPAAGLHSLTGRGVDRIATSRTSRERRLNALSPMPGSPTTIATPPLPSRARSKQAISLAGSCRRPTKGISPAKAERSSRS